MHEAFLLAGALAVSAVPEGLAATVAAALAPRGRAIVRCGAIIRCPEATVEVERRRLDVVARALSDDEAAALWPHVLEAAPDDSRYPRRSGRRPPLLRLAPTAGVAADREEGP